MALTKTQVSELYVAIFNRASEGEGNTFWQTNNDSAAAAADAMIATQDAQDYFGTSLDTNQAFIEHIYENTLGKTYAEDTDGVDFWVSRLDSGEYTRGEVVSDLVAAVADYSDSTDTETKAAYDQFTNRVEVSDYMADTVQEAPADYDTSTAFDGDLTVTSDSSTVDSAKSDVDTLAATPGQSFTLTENEATVDYSMNTGPVEVTLDGDDDATEGTEFDVTLSRYDDTVILDSYKDAVLKGGDGTDTLNLIELSPGANNADVNLAAGTTGAISPGGGTTTVVGFENVIASDDGGRIVGTTGANEITLGEGTDDISTSGGDDSIKATDDTFLSGTDIIDGGSGTDTFTLTGEKSATFAQADFTAVENIVINGVSGDDVTVTAADLFDGASSATSAITNGVQTLEIVDGGDNAMTLTAAAGSINLIGVTIKGLEDKLDTLTLDSTAGVNQIIVDENSLDGIKNVEMTDTTTDEMILVGGGTFDYSETVFSDVANTDTLNMDGTSKDDTVVFGGSTTIVTDVDLKGGDNTVTIAGSLVGDISALNGGTNSFERVDFGSANYLTVADDLGTGPSVISVTGTSGSDTLVITDDGGAGAITADFSGTAISDVETIVFDAEGNSSEFIVKSTTISSGMTLQGDSATDTLTIGGANVSLEGVTFEDFEIIDTNGQALESSTAALDGLQLTNEHATDDGKVTLTDNSSATLKGTGAAYNNNLEINGTSDADDLTIKSFDDSTGDFVLKTKAGDDMVSIGSGNGLTAGNATIELGADDDTLDLGANHADVAGGTLDGGTGTDTVEFVGDISTGDLSTGDYSAFETLAYGSATINDVAFALGAGDIDVDTIDFTADTDDTGTNTIDLSAYDGGDATIKGSAGTDTITTSVNDDTVDAGAGNDSITISGDSANNNATTYGVTLGAGEDTLVMGANTASTAGNDDEASVTVADFSVSDDTIDLNTGLGLAAANFVDQATAQAIVDNADPSTLGEAMTALEDGIGDGTGVAGTDLYSTVFQFEENTYIGIMDDSDTYVDNYTIKLDGLHDLTAADNLILG